MLTKRNLITVLIMIFVILVLFLSSVALREYYNDYDVNHTAEPEPVKRINGTSADENADKDRVLYFGQEDNGYFNVINEWATYRKKAFIPFSSLDNVYEITGTANKGKEYLLADGELLHTNTEEYAKILTEYVNGGGVVIFYRMPSYNTIKECETLKDLLGIQHLRAESVKLNEIRIYGGFLLGGETHYPFENVENPSLADMEREIPWYDVSSRTKTYMAGFVSEGEKSSLNVNNEDMPAIIWRSNLGDGSVFAVNGDYIKSSGMGIIDAMVYETEEYVLYPVVNAQNLCVTGFPDLTNENEKKMEEVYGMTVEQFCRDILWPSFVAAAEKNDWKLTSFVSVKQNDNTKEEPKTDKIIEYLKYFNEESAEAGVSLGRMGSSDIRRSVKSEKAEIDKIKLNYRFSGGYVLNENKDKLLNLINQNGKMDYFEDISTVVGEYEAGHRILYFMTDNITYQNVTLDAYKHSYRDSLTLKSTETALGYSSAQIDMYRVLWPESEKDQWQNLADKMSSNIDTYWRPFSAFDRTTISQSDKRVRNFLNGSVKSSKEGNCISVKTEGFVGEAYLLLRTHGEKISDMTGGSYKQVENDTYLLKLTSDTSEITVNLKTELYYKE